MDVLKYTNGSFTINDTSISDLADIKENTTQFSSTDSPEFLEITLDSDGKVLDGITVDGIKRVYIPSKFETLMLGDGTEITSLTDFEHALIDNGFQPGGVGDWSNSSELHIQIPKLARVNITNDTGTAVWPTSKSNNYQYTLEFYDMQGNYFKKNVIVNAQGNSSLSDPKKNLSIDICNDEWIGDDTFNLKIGTWVAQDSFHIKAYHSDYLCGKPVVAYQLYNEMIMTRPVYDNRCWKRALLPDMDTSVGTSMNSMSDYDTDLVYDTGARCFPDGFPCVMYLNGEFYGLYCWQLKKHRDNYHQEKDNGYHIHLDGNMSTALIWGANGTLDWRKLAGVVQESESSTSTDGLEIRNPKGLVLRNGYEYDFDAIHAYASDCSEDNVELVCDEDTEYSTLMTEAVAMTDEKKKKKRIAALEYTSITKKAIVKLSTYMTYLSTCESSGKTSTEMKTEISNLFDVESIIDYIIFSDLICNIDGFKKNWQWNTWDGAKWAVSPYDLDWTFGYYGDLAPVSSHLGNNTSKPTGWVIKYYSSELNDRYAELRNASIIDVDNMISKINEWTLNIGLDNYELENEKWPSKPKDNIYRLYNWIKLCISNLDSVYEYNNQ